MPWHRALPPAARARGLTLLELLVVLAILAVASAGAALALRDPDRQALQREGERLAALLEAGRGWSRSTGLPLTWQAGPEGFRFTGRDPQAPPQPWLQPGVEVEWPAEQARRELVLGPEPIVAAQSLVLRLREQRLQLGTDGLKPFSVGGP